MFSEHSIVKTIKDLLESIPIGSMGTVVQVYTDPRLAYEVEFVDNTGKSEVLTVKPDEIELVKKY